MGYYDPANYGKKKIEDSRVVIRYNFSEDEHLR